jgi:hypothetical protein
MLPVSTRIQLPHRALASIFFGVLTLGVAPVVEAEHCIDYVTQTLHATTIASQPGTPIGIHVTVVGNRAYTSGEVGSMRIYDISNPLAAVLLGSSSNFYARGDIQAAGDFAYMAGFTGLTVFDVSSPAAITMRGNAPISGATSVVLLAQYAYVGGSGGVSVVDVTLPGSPAIVGTLTGMNVVEAVVRDGRLYVLSNVGLRIYDLTAPAAPALLGWLDATAAGNRDLDVAGGRAFTASSDGFRVLDVSDPSVPAAMAFIPWDSYSSYYDLIADGDRVYVTNQHEAYWCMVDLYDVSQPNLPAHVGSCRLPDSANPQMALTLAGGHVFVVGAKFWVIDVDPAQRSAPPIGFVDTPGNALHVAVSGSHAFVADETSLQIVDLAVPSAPRIIGSLPLAAKLVSAEGNLLLVGGAARTLVDISNPSQPSILGNLPGASATDVELVGNRAFVCNGGPFEIYDVTNPAAPVPAGAIGNGVTRLEVEGNHAYLAENGTVTVVDVSGPLPSIVATNGAVADASLDVAAEYLYAGKGGGGHQLTSLYDIKDPAALVIEGYFEARVKMVAGDEDVFYAIAPRVAGSGFNELVILSVHDPGWWNSLGVIPLADFAHSVHVAGGYVFVAEGASGVYLYPKYCTATDVGGEHATASHLRLLPAWPNPAHEFTNWKLDLPRAATVRLEVCGRRVRSVWNRPLPGGRHVLGWDGRDDSRRQVASGVYMVRVGTPDGEARSRVNWTR